MSREDLMREVHGLHKWLSGVVVVVKEHHGHYIVGVKCNHAIWYIATSKKYRVGEKIEVYTSIDGKKMAVLGESMGEIKKR